MQMKQLNADDKIAAIMKLLNEYSSYYCNDENYREVHLSFIDPVNELPAWVIKDETEFYEILLEMHKNELIELVDQEMTYCLIPASNSTVF